MIENFFNLLWEIPIILIMCLQHHSTYKVVVKTETKKIEPIVEEIVAEIVVKPKK